MWTYIGCPRTTDKYFFMEKVTLVGVLDQLNTDHVWGRAHCRACLFYAYTCVKMSDTTDLTIEFLKKHVITVWPQRPYSPDLARATWLFPKHKKTLRWITFVSTQEVQNAFFREVGVLQHLSKMAGMMGLCIDEGMQYSEKEKNWINRKWGIRFLVVLFSVVFGQPSNLLFCKRLPIFLGVHTIRHLF